MKTLSILTTVGAITMALAAPVAAQAPADAQTAQAASTTKTSWNGLPDRFQIDAGYFRLNASSTLRLQGTVGTATDVSFEKDLGVPKTADTLWLDTTIRVGRRSQFKVGYMSFTREGTSHTLTRDFTWNGEVYSAGLTANASLETELFSTYYRLSIIKRDRFEIGPAVGLGWLKLTAAVAAQGSLTMPGGQVKSVSLDDGGSLGVPTADIGAFFNAWLAKRVVLRGDFLYIFIKPEDWDASVKDGRIAVDFYPWRHFGFGAQYKFQRVPLRPEAPEGVPWRLNRVPGHAGLRVVPVLRILRGGRGSAAVDLPRLLPGHRHADAPGGPHLFRWRPSY